MLRRVPEQAPARWREAADAVWLAAHRDRYAGVGSAPERPGQDGLRPLVDRPLPANRRDIEDVWGPDALPAPEPLGPAHGSRPGVGRSGEPAGESWVLPDTQDDVTLHVGRAQLPDGGRPQHGVGCSTALFTRALHRLARRIPFRDTLELDEGTTAEQGVVDGMWMPFLRLSRTAAFDLVLLTDDAPAMRIWECTSARPARSAEGIGTFRGVRTIQVNVPRTGTATLRWSARRAVADSAGLLDGRGGRTFLLVTDGLAHGWAAADGLLGRLAHAGPTVLVHLLPPHLRHRITLYTYPAVLEAGGFGAPSDHLGHRPPSGGSDPMRPLPDAGDDSVAVQVLSLKPASLAAWSDLVTDGRGVRRSLPVVPAGTLSKGAPAPGLRASRLPRAAAVPRFSTSPPARRLATQLAAITFDFDLVEQLRRRVMPEPSPDHLAEILMGGLIDWEGGGEGRPEFAEGVREALLATTTRSQLARTVSVVGELPAAGERGVALRAALYDPLRARLPGPEERGWAQ